MTALASQCDGFGFSNVPTRLLHSGLKNYVLHPARCRTRLRACCGGRFGATVGKNMQSIAEKRVMTGCVLAPTDWVRVGATWSGIRLPELTPAPVRRHARV
jgi:hypothetical protein